MFTGYGGCNQKRNCSLIAYALDDHSKVTKMDWDLGDGTVLSTSATPSSVGSSFTIFHTYPKKGTYTLKVSGTDSKGQQSNVLSFTVSP